MKKGFTLVEVLVAIIILSIGILAVSQMTVMGMKTSTVINQRLYARTVMARMFEDLNSRPPGDAWLLDTNGDTALNITDSTADHLTTVTDSLARIAYQARWNIADGVPENGLKTVRLFILWGPTLENNIHTDLIIKM